MDGPEDTVDIRIRDVPRSLRQRFKAACAKEGETYETMLAKFVALHENRPGVIEQASLERDRDR